MSGADVQAVHEGASGAKAPDWPRLPDLVPFWKPPNIRERMISTTISSNTNSRQPLARDRCPPRPPLHLYIDRCIPRLRAICRPRRIIWASAPNYLGQFG